MKINALKKCTLLCMLMFNCVAFAQLYGTSGTQSSNMEGDDPQTTQEEPGETPIDSKLVLLAITGVCFGYFYYTKNRKAQTS